MKTLAKASEPGVGLGLFCRLNSTIWATVRGHHINFLSNDLQVEFYEVILIVTIE